MKHVGKALITAGALSLCGIAFLGLGTSMLYKERKSGIVRNNTKYEEKQYTTVASGITEIKTDIAADNLYFEPGDGDKIEITYNDKIDNPRYEITEKGGTLFIYQKPINDFRLFYIPDLRFGWEEAEVISMTIKVPAAYAGSYDLNVSSGTISLQELDIKEELDAYATSGTIKLNKLSCEKDVEIEISSGNISIEDIQVQEDLACRSTSGHVSVNDITVGGDWNIRISSGNINVSTAQIGGKLYSDFTSGQIIGSEISASEVEATLSSGKINLDKLTVEKGINASLTSGTLRVSLTDSAANYSIKSEVTSGHCNLPESFATRGDKYIDVEVTSGNVEFSFGE